MGEARILLEELLDAIYPPRCPVCGSAPSAGSACAQHALPVEDRAPRCGRCALRLSPNLPDGRVCADCRADPPAFRRTLALGEYREEPGLRDWVLALKHRGRADLARELGAELGARLARRLEQEGAGAGGREWIVPVPLHPLRRLERGYDQAFLLARAAAEAAGVPLAQLLRRTRWSPPQGAAGAVSRAANVSAAFRPRRRPRARLNGARVWLVDDVLTSGATASECARVLKGMGAREVGVLCVARVRLQARGSPSEAVRAR